MLDALLRDARQGARALRSRPGFTLVSVTILAVAIGGSTSMFSVVNGLLLRPLPLKEPGQLFRIWKNDRERGFDHYALTYPEYVEWRRSSFQWQSLAALWAWDRDTVILSGFPEPTRIHVAKVSSNFFDVLGVDATLGRTFAERDEDATAVPPLLLSHQVWLNRFGADPALIGRVVRGRDEVDFEVIGVMPERFDFLPATDGWVPALATNPDWEATRSCECDLIGRLSTDSDPEKARTELQTIHENLVSDQPEAYRPMEVVITPLLDTIVGNTGAGSILALAAAGVLLAIAIANLGGLSLARANGRQRDLAVRSAMGASRSTLARELIAESLLLSALGLGGGLVVTSVGLDGLLFFKGADLPGADGIQLDFRTVVFSMIATVSACIGFGVVPAWFATNVDPIGPLRGKSVGVRHHRGLNALVAGEVALAFVLLTVGGLMVQTLIAQQSIERGFSSDGLFSVSVLPSPSKTPDPASRLAFMDSFVAELSGQPGVESATLVRENPSSGWSGISAPLIFEGQTDEVAGDNPMTNIEMASPNYFSTLRVRLSRGRAFNEFDRTDGERVAIVSESTARRYWPGEDPIGKMVGRDIQHRVVGVAADTRYRSLLTRWPTVYYPLRQNPFSRERELHPALIPNHVVVRSSLPEEAVFPAMRAAARRLDEDIFVERTMAVSEMLDGDLSEPRFNAWITSLFSIVSTMLASLGVFGVATAYVAVRRPELGLRLALGATTAELRRLVLRRGCVLAGTGTLLGVAVSLSVGLLLEGFLYGVTPFHFRTLATVAAIMLVIVLASTFVPAEHASRVNPLDVLRAE